MADQNKDQLKDEKIKLKGLRTILKESALIDSIKDELIEKVNTLIGRINCYLTDNDRALERLAKIDGLRN